MIALEKHDIRALAHIEIERDRIAQRIKELETEAERLHALQDEVSTDLESFVASRVKAAGEKFDGQIWERSGDSLVVKPEK